MNVIEKIRNDHLKVDLQTPVTTSVRESFLYAGLARERPGAHSFRMSIKVSVLVPLYLKEFVLRANIFSGSIYIYFNEHSILKRFIYTRVVESISIGIASS